MGSMNIALIGDVRSVRGVKETQQGNVYMMKSTGRQGQRETRDETLLL